MLNTLVVGDLHIRASHLEEARMVFSAIEQEAEANKVGRLVFLGDVYDGKAIIHADCQTLFFSAIKKLTKKINEIFILVGNHDFSSTNLGNHSLYPIACMDTVYVVDQASYWEDVAFIAYNDKAFVEDRIKEANRVGSKYIFGHFSVDGFTYGNGHKAEDGVNPNLIKGQAILGHFHTPQDVGNIHYVGSPYSISFGEANTLDKRRFALITDNGLSFIPLKKYNLPHHVVWDFNNTLFQIEQQKSAIVKIINIPFNELDKVKEACDNVFMSCSYVTLPAFNGEVRLDAAKTNEDIFREYVEKDYLSNKFTQLDKEKLIRLGNELLHPQEE